MNRETNNRMVIGQKRVLNLGSGVRTIKGAVNIDYYASQADVRHDLNVYPYPLEDSAFDEIYAWNVIEHLDDVIAAMHEIHRVGDDGCLVHIRVPHFRSACLYEDLTHRHGFAWRSFDIFVEGGSVYGEYTRCRYEIASRRFTPYIIPTLYRVLSWIPSLTDNLLSKYIPMASIEFVLRVRKPSSASQQNISHSD